MAINNTVSSSLGSMAAPFVNAAKSVGGFLTAPPLGGGQPSAQGLAAPASTSTSSPIGQGSLNLSGSIPGLVNPVAHPALGSLSTQAPVSHTITTNPDGTQVSSVKYPNGNTASSDGTSSSGTQQNTQSTGAFPGIVSSLQSTAAANTAPGQEANQIAQSYAPGFNALLPQVKSEAGDLTTGTTPVASGNAAVAANVGSSEANTLAQGEQAALAGIAPQQTGLQQEAQAQQAAGNLVQPTQVAPGTSLVSPDTGSTVFSGLGGLQSYQAEQLSNAQRGTYGAQSQSISTGLAAMSNTYQNVQAIAQANGINPTQYPTANGLISALQANITSPGGQAAFTEAMNALKTQMAQQIQNFASTGALTPTVSGNFVSALNSANLSPSELGQLYDAVTATGLANLQATATAFNQANTATQSATLPSSFGSSQAPQSSYTPPTSISSGSDPFDPANFNF